MGRSFLLFLFIVPHKVLSHLRAVVSAVGELAGVSDPRLRSQTPRDGWLLEGGHWAISSQCPRGCGCPSGVTLTLLCILLTLV